MTESQDDYRVYIHILFPLRQIIGADWLGPLGQDLQGSVGV